MYCGPLGETRRKSSGIDITALVHNGTFSIYVTSFLQSTTTSCNQETEKNTKKSIETSLLNRHTHKTDFLAYYMAMVLKNVR